MTNVSEEICTCGNEEMPYTGHHDASCELQSHDDFYYGNVKWTGEGFEEIPADVSWAEVYAQDDDDDDDWEGWDDLSGWDTGPPKEKATPVPDGPAETIPDGWKPKVPKGYNSAKETLPGPSGKTCTCKPVKLNSCGLCHVKSASVKIKEGTVVYVWLFDPKATTDWGGTTYGTYTQKCRHYETPVIFPDGTVVQASSGSGFTERKQPVPSLGVYLDGIWTPQCRAYHLGWKDYGLPTVPIAVMEQIMREAVTMARNRHVVEFGCIGGHGRTGTALACLAVMCGVPDPEKAVDYVRDNYCHEAIESDVQEWFVKAYAAHLYGYEAPPKPEPKKSTTVTTWNKGTTSTTTTKSGAYHTIGEHKQVWERGGSCTCQWWDTDKQSFIKKGSTVLSDWKHALWK